MTTDTKLAEVMALADKLAFAYMPLREMRYTEARAALESAVAGILDALEAAHAAQRDATALAMDAEAKAVRYIWLRDNPDPQWRPFALRDDCNGREADARVDAALSKTQPRSNAIRPDDPSPGSRIKGEQP